MNHSTLIMMNPAKLQHNKGFSPSKVQSIDKLLHHTTPSKGYGQKAGSIPGILLEKDERDLLK